MATIQLSQIVILSPGQKVITHVQRLDSFYMIVFYLMNLWIFGSMEVAGPGRAFGLNDSLSVS